MTEGAPSPWARPVPGQAPAEVGLAPATPEVLAPSSPTGTTQPGVPIGTGQPTVPTGTRQPSLPPQPIVPGGSSSPGGGPGTSGGAGLPTERHPADPDETPSTKAWAVLALGVVGVLLMFCGGGLAPGLAGLVLARPARAEITAAAGFLTGGRALRAGEILSWIAVSVSAIVIVAVVIGLLIGSVGNGPQYDENVN